MYKITTQTCVYNDLSRTITRTVPPYTRDRPIPHCGLYVAYHNYGRHQTKCNFGRISDLIYFDVFHIFLLLVISNKM